MCLGGYLLGRPCCPPPVGIHIHPAKVKKAPVPLVGVRTTVQIIDFTAEVTLKQRYENIEKDPVEAIYRFPLQENASVCGFEALIDGKVIQGTVKEREEARDEYDDALAAGHGAYMLEESKDKPNMFEASIGNLPPGKEVIITIKYVIELHVGADKTVHFLLPTTRAIPNGTPGYTMFHVPKKEVDDSPEHIEYGLHLDIYLDSTSDIASVTSSTHPIDRQPAASGSAGVHASRRSLIRLMTDPKYPLVDNFQMDIKLANPHEPSIKIQQDDVTKDKVAMISVFPNQDLGEYDTIYTEMIFLIDRSGSMAGSKINKVRDTMQLFLRSIPEGTLFNIVGFGTRHEFLFPEGSVEYNERTLAHATQHIGGLAANLGGTEILRPLEAIFGQPAKEGIPRQVFILTDGQVKNTSDCIDSVRRHARTTRVFTFGMGHDVDRALVTGMAKAGEGAHEFIDDSATNIELLILNQLKRALQPALTDLTVNFSDPKLSTKLAPFRTPPLWAGSRLVLYTFLANDAAPGTISLSAKSASGSDFNMKLDIDPSQVILGNSIFKLAAKRMIQELEDGRSFMHDDQGNVRGGQDPNAEILRLSIGSQILSKLTAFVAVEKRDTPTEGTMQQRQMTAPREQQSPMKLQKPASPRGAVALGGRGRGVSGGSGGGGGGGGFLGMFKKKSSSAAAPPMRSSSIFQSSKKGSVSEDKKMTKEKEVGSVRSRAPGGGPPRDRLAMPSMESSLSSTTNTSHAPLAKRKMDMAPKMMMADSAPLRSAGPPSARPSSSSSSSFAPPPAPPSSSSSSSAVVSYPSSSDQSLPALLQLIKTQNFNGSFPHACLGSILFADRAISSKPLSHIFDAASLPPSVPRSDAVESILITVSVAPYFFKSFSSDKSYWELVAQKARTYVHRESKKAAIPADVDLFALLSSLL
eukprot:TRINITY_DN3212_c0_g1_i2.p1 TRINITY_DN3212_c0_g1~~TRINITY_DN3212_c0_g1_i2.p1  ORF type:complete len:921 (-),score=240.09 TRINITY_DN3212_c0_g1_i2:11-2773(-)